MSNNKSFDIIQNTLNSKGYKSMQETLINTMKAIYNNDDTLKKKYKSDDDFINAIRKTDAKGFLTDIYKLKKKLFEYTYKDLQIIEIKK